jgi:DNA-binding transcriptional ArsR family regulator
MNLYAKMSDRVRLLGALADPTRLRILLALKENELSVA